MNAARSQGGSAQGNNRYFDTDRDRSLILLGIAGVRSLCAFNYFARGSAMGGRIRGRDGFAGSPLVHSLRYSAPIQT